MALTITSRGTGTHNTAATTLVPGGRTATLAKGSMGVLAIAYDNAGSGGASLIAPATWTDAKNNVWTRRINDLFDNGAASAGIEMVFYTATIDTALLTGDLGTITWLAGATPTAKAFTWYEVIPSSASFHVEYDTGGTIAGATAANAQVTTATIQVGNGVIAGYFSENVAAVTGDSDSTNGSWTAQQTATVGTTTSGVRIATQQKVQTTTASTQSYDVTVASQDRIAGYIAVKEVPNQGYGQAQAKILGTGNGFGQAQTTIALKLAQVIVANPAAPNAGDAEIKTDLLALNFRVDYISHNAAANVTGVDLVVISESVTSTSVNTKYRDVTVPVLVVEGGITDDMAFSTTAESTGAITQLVVQAPSHPIANGLTGTQTTYSAGQTTTIVDTATDGRVASALVILSTTAAADNAVLFIFETGASLAGGNTAQARRAFFGYTGDSSVATNFNATGQGFWDRTVIWLTSTLTNASGQAQATIQGAKTKSAQAQAYISGSATTVVDAFNRSQTDSWGSADTGGSYTIEIGAAADFDVSGTQGTIANAQTDHKVSLERVLAPQKYDLYAEYAISVVPAAGKFYFVDFVLSDAGPNKATTIVPGYYVEVAFDSTGVTASIGSGASSLASTSTFAYTATDLWAVKARLLSIPGKNIVGMVKTWKVGTAEPDWSTGSGIASDILPTGFFSVQTYSFGSPSAATATFDNFAVYSAFPQSWGQSQADIKAIGRVFGQTQADIKAVGRGHGQAQADIKQTYPLKFTYETVVTNDGATSFWKFNETSGNPQDSIGGNHVTSISGTPTYAVAGLISQNADKAIDVNNVQFTVLDHANLDLGDIGSIEIWAKPDTIALSYLFDKGSNAYALYLDDSGIINFSKSGIGVLAHSSVSLSTGTTYHIVATKNGSSIKIYINGVDRTIIDNTFTLADNTTDLVIAKAGILAFDGVIDNGALYKNTVLTVEQVATHYTIGTKEGNSAQAQADIKAVGRGHGQSQADIKAISYGLGQSNADIKAIGRGFGQANAYIRPRVGLGQAQGFIRKSAGYGQAAGLINGTYFLPFTDTFTRSVSDSLGTSDNGDTWVLQTGTAANSDVNGSQATIITQTATRQVWDLNTTLIKANGVEVGFTVSLNKTPINPVAIRLILESSFNVFQSNSGIGAQFGVNSGTTISADAYIAGGGTSANLGFTTGDTYNIKAHHVKVSAGQILLRVKVWKVGDVEPGWQESTAVTSQLLIGHPRIVADFINDANSPYTWTIDNLHIEEAWVTRSGQAQADIKAKGNAFG